MPTIVPEMTFQEAFSIVAKIAHEYRAFKKLEDALEIAKHIEQFENEAQFRKTDLSNQLEELVAQLRRLRVEISNIEIDKGNIEAEFSIQKAEADADLQKFRSVLEDEIKELKVSSANQIAELEDAVKDRQIDLDKETEAKVDYLKTITNKIEKAEAELALIKKRLG